MSAFRSGLAIIGINVGMYFSHISIFLTFFIFAASCTPANSTAETARNNEKLSGDYAAKEIPLPDDFSTDYDIMDSGGTLIPQQSAFQVYYYDLNFTIHPPDSSIAGNTATYAQIVHPTDQLVLDFDTTFAIESLHLKTNGQFNEKAEFQNRQGQLWIDAGKTLQPDDLIELRINYEGRPRIAENPPWDGGFVWDYSSEGDPWIGVACQMNGANIWWPGKDHPSDRADSVSISVTVPDDLVAASNGRSEGMRENDDGTATYDWFVSTPINNYGVTINIAPYTKLERKYESVTGEIIPIYFWALPENADNARGLMPQIMDQMRHFEEILGPYPFRADKYGVAEAPYFGMEHQTLIAYGAGYRDDTTFDTGSGFDDLHHHELAHEWWANLVTNADWKDFWIHEGFGTYMSPLYAEHLHGKEQYHHFMDSFRDQIVNLQPVAGRTSKSTSEMYIGRDIYYKGAWMLHTLRYLVGEEKMMQSLRRMAYPDEAMEEVTDGSHTRYASSNDYINLIEKLTGEDYSWFFDIYLYSADLPELVKEERDGQLFLNWDTPDDLPFEIPVELVIDGQPDTRTIGREPVDVADSGAEVIIDPDNWILREE